MKTSLPRFFFFFFFGLYLYLSGTVGASHDLYTLPFEAAAAAPTTTSFRLLRLGLCCGPFIFFIMVFSALSRVGSVWLGVSSRPTMPTHQLRLDLFSYLAVFISFSFALTLGNLEPGLSYRISYPQTLGTYLVSPSNDGLGFHTLAYVTTHRKRSNNRPLPPPFHSKIIFGVVSLVSIQLLSLLGPCVIL